MYSIEIPASGGASINNDTEGFGWFTGVATGVLPWRGPIIGFRAAALNDALCDGGDLLDVNVTQFAGTNATASGGRPEVNTTHVAGTSQTARDIGASVLLSNGTGTGQVSLTSGRVNADVTHIATAAVSTSTAQLGVNVVNAAGTAWGSGAITAASLAADAGTELADAIHDEVVEGSTTMRQLLRLFAAVLTGKASGLGTTTAVYRDIGDTKDRITATVDADGNRTAVTRDAT
jgi:hypothetical protein